MTIENAIPGYTYHDPKLPASPVTLADLERLQKVLLFGPDDIHHLRLSAQFLAEHVDAILDIWYGFVASTPELVVFFGDVKTGQPDGAYLAAVRRRFGQWILDTARAEYDQTWLNYQHEIGLRHHRTKKNLTDGANSLPEINYRYVVALTIPITATLKPFLAKGGHAPDLVEKMHQAWIKSVLLQTILWGVPFVGAGAW